MMLISGIIILALLAPVEPFKLSLKPPGTPTDQQPPQQQVQQQQSLLYPTQQHQEQAPLHESAGIKGVQLAERDQIKTQNPVVSVAPAPLPLAPQPPALAYIIVRPLQAHNQYYDSLAYNRPAYPPAPLLPLRLEDQEQQQGQLQPTPLDQIPQKYQGKLSKLKSHFDKVLAKLTLGSSYQVVGEEIQQPGQDTQQVQQIQNQGQGQRENQAQNQSQGQIQIQNQNQYQNQGESADNQNLAQQNYSDPYTGFDARKRSSY